MDPVRISKTMAFLLRHRPDIGDLDPDDDGWVPLDDLCRALSRMMRIDITSAIVADLVDGADVARFEIEAHRVRAVVRSARGRGARRLPRCQPPDILYHATTSRQAEEIGRTGVLSAGRDKLVVLSADEAHAWRVAHRMADGPARVLFVDASRARRHGVQFYRNRRTGLYASSPVPSRDILNLLDGFGEQHSAGGFPIAPGPDGQPRVALIQVSRRSGTTWEVAKGKLEPGETPEAAAIREVREEMGMQANLRITRFLDAVRYGFMAPGGLPRLKTVFLYLMEPVEPVGDLSPRTAEGIGDVGWFTIDDAVRAVTHTSLQPVMLRLRDALQAGPAPAEDG